MAKMPNGRARGGKEETRVDVPLAKGGGDVSDWVHGLLGKRGAVQQELERACGCVTG